MGSSPSQASRPGGVLIAGRSRKQTISLWGTIGHKMPVTYTDLISRSGLKDKYKKLVLGMTENLAPNLLAFEQYDPQHVRYLDAKAIKQLLTDQRDVIIAKYPTTTFAPVSDDMIAHLLKQYANDGPGVKFTSFDGLWKFIFAGLLICTIKIKGQSVMHVQENNLPDSAPLKPTRAVVLCEVDAPPDIPVIVADKKFNADSTAQLMNEIFSNRSKESILAILLNINNEQRQQLRQKFQEVYSCDLLSKILSKVPENAKKFYQGLVVSTWESTAMFLHDVLCGDDVDVVVVCEVLFCQPPNYNDKVMSSYQQLYNKSIENDFDRHANVAMFILKLLLNPERKWNTPANLEKAKEDARFLNGILTKKQRNDDDVELIAMLCSSSFQQIRALVNAYFNFTGHRIDVDVEKIFTGRQLDVILTMIAIACGPSQYFARRLQFALDDYSHCESNVIYIIISRAEIDLACIKRDFIPINQTSLGRGLRLATSKSNLQSCLLAIIRDGEDESFYKLQVTGVAARPLIKHNQSTQNEKITVDLYDAMRGFGNDETVLVKVLLSIDSKQRQEIASVYQVMFGRSLVQDLDGDVSQQFEDFLSSLLVEPCEYLAHCLHDAVGQQNTTPDLDRAIQILCCCTNEEIKGIQEEYAQHYASFLSRDIDSATSGSLNHLLMLLLKGTRDDANKPVDIDLAGMEATSLYSSVKSWITNTKTWNQLIATRNAAQLRETFSQYFKVSGYEVMRTLSEEFKGNLLLAYNVTLRSASKPSTYFATCLQDALNNNDLQTVNMILIWRAEIDLRDIIEEYPSIAKEHLIHAVLRVTKGDYSRALRAMLDLA